VAFAAARRLAHGAPAALAVVAVVEEAAVLRPGHVDEDLEVEGWAASRNARGGTW
jgi:hypothetical protein